jgi:hypothetical protein
LEIQNSKVCKNGADSVEGYIEVCLREREIIPYFERSGTPTIERNVLIFDRSI